MVVVTLSTTAVRAGGPRWPAALRFVGSSALRGCDGDASKEGSPARTIAALAGTQFLDGAEVALINHDEAAWSRRVWSRVWTASESKGGGRPNGAKPTEWLSTQMAGGTGGGLLVGG